MTKNIIALLKGFVTPPNDGMDNRIAVSTVQAHLMQYGYMLDEQAFMEMSKADLSWIQTFNNEVVQFVKEKKGGKLNYQPLYKNFPQEVMSKTDYELFWNAVRHYWTNGAWEPSTHTYEREIKFEKVKYTILKYADDATFNNIFTSLVAINTSLTPQDLEAVKWFVNSGIELVFPAQIPFKENLMTLAAMGIPGLPIKTPTDVLRIAAHLSGGDISLPAVPPAKIKMNRWSSAKSLNPERAKFQFKKFKRAERKYLLALLEQTHCNPSEMVLKDQRWIRLGEILHPGEYKAQYPKAFEAFKKIREGNVTSWYGQVEKAFKTSFDVGLAKLSERPGEFARRLDYLVRKNPSRIESIMQTWQNCIEGTSNKVLFEQYTHFENRREAKNNRSIFVKGARRPISLPSLPAIKPEIIETIHANIFSGLRNKFSKLEPLGNCWIDEELKKIPLPTNMRSMDFTLKPTIRGQRTPFGNPDTKVVRAFYHWFDKHGALDPDLSATFVGDKKHSTLSYSGLRVGKSCHSGDIIARRGACAEYVDIDIADALACGYKYVLIDVRNYRGGSLKEMQGVFGTMEREFPESGTTWLPETVANCQESNSSASVTLMSIIDLRTKEYIFLDIDSTGPTFARGDVSSILKSIEKYAEPPKVSVYDLVLMHVEGRGRQVNLDNNVDTYFKAEDFMHSYEKTGELMGV